MVKKIKVGKENLYLTEIRLSRNKLWCHSAAENHNYMYMCHICAKGF